MTDTHDKHAQWLIGQAKSGRMSRREFLGRTSALGIALGVGTGLFSDAMAATPKKGGHMRLGMGHGSTTDTLNPATSKTVHSGLRFTELQTRWLNLHPMVSLCRRLRPSGARQMTQKHGLSNCGMMWSSTTGKP